MKKIIVALMIFASSSFVFANQMNTGCGLGTMLLGDKADTKLMQILVTTTNATTTNQSIGITLNIDSFGCRRTANWVVNEKVDVFVQGNMDNLVRDIAAGNGETIDALAALLDVQDTDAFGTKLQNHFDLIFPNADVEYAHVTNAIYLVSLS